MPFCFSAPCQFTPILSLRPLIFGLKLCWWSVSSISVFLWEYNFYLRLFDLQPFISGLQLDRKKRPSVLVIKDAVITEGALMLMILCRYKLYSGFIEGIIVLNIYSYETKGFP